VGNLVEYRYNVNVVAPAGSSALLLPAGLVVLGIVLGALLGLVLPRYGIRIPFLPTRKREETVAGEGEAGATEEPAAEEGEVREPVAEDASSAEPSAEEVAATQVEDDRLVRLRKAYDDGRISKEAYEENLRKLKGGSR
ncbi:MAG: hypothetical protein ACRD1Z_13685, partial [Vicinamibacteria bacterium]